MSEARTSGDKLVFAIDMPARRAASTCRAFPRVVASDTLRSAARRAAQRIGIHPAGAAASNRRAREQPRRREHVSSANIVDARASIPPAPAETAIDARTVSARGATGLSIHGWAPAWRPRPECHGHAGAAQHRCDAARAGTGAGRRGRGRDAGTGAASRRLPGRHRGCRKRRRCRTRARERRRGGGGTRNDRRARRGVGGFRGTGAVSLAFPGRGAAASDRRGTRRHQRSLVSPAPGSTAGGAPCGRAPSHRRRQRRYIGDFVWDEGRIVARQLRRRAAGDARAAGRTCAAGALDAHAQGRLVGGRDSAAGRNATRRARWRRCVRDRRRHRRPGARARHRGAGSQRALRRRQRRRARIDALGARWQCRGHAGARGGRRRRAGPPLARRAAHVRSLRRRRVAAPVAVVAGHAGGARRPPRTSRSRRSGRWRARC